MNEKPAQDDPIRLFLLWTPRVLVGISIVLLLYFTQRTYRFSGLFDDTFLAEENLNLIRGPLAKKEYYERGLLEYQASSLFPEEEEAFEEEPFAVDVSELEVATEPEEETGEE